MIFFSFMGVTDTASVVDAKVERPVPTQKVKMTCTGETSEKEARLTRRGSNSKQ
jgi:hypothetical protein